MSFAICRVQKVKGAAAVTGLQLHDRREREHSNTNPDINRERTKDNYTLIDTPTKTFNTLADERIKVGYTGKKAVRKDAVKVCEVLFTSDTAFFEGKSLEEQQIFFADCFFWAKERFGESNIFAASVHMDEATPHLHLDFVPLTADGRLSAKSVLGDRFALQRLQDDFYNKIGKPWGMERGERADLEDTKAPKPKKHRETAAYKRDEYVRLQKEVNILVEQRNAAKLDLKEIEDEKFRLLRENSDNFKQAKESAENIISEAHKIASDIVSKAQCSIETLAEEEWALKRSINGLQDEFKNKRQDLLKKNEVFEKKINQARIEMEQHLKSETEKHEKTTAMIHELEHPKSLKNTFSGVKMSYDDFKMLSAAAVRIYSAENEAFQAKNELEEFKKRYNHKSFDALKREHDGRLKEFAELGNQNRIMKKELGFSNEADYNQISKALKQNNNRGKNYAK